ncbi:MAG: hypothetical protein HYS32_01765 [Candidatus Woesearchaeota archaeon]|nr:MAG: hypothetical protein HYS32_01765 [Candidatus Woesearchaeota archaeon]
MDDNKWSSLILSLKNSFQLVKSDMNLLTQKDFELEGKIENLSKRLNNIEKFIYSNATPIQETGEIEEEISIKSGFEDLTKITPAQQNLLIMLYKLLNESGREWVSMKNLTLEIHPKKEYKNIKSLISDYTNILSDLGLVRKTRKGRETYLTLTEKAKKSLKKVKKEITIRNRQTI